MWPEPRESRQKTVVLAATLGLQMMSRPKHGGAAQVALDCAADAETPAR
jgi:hypothetical protein